MGELLLVTVREVMEDLLIVEIADTCLRKSGRAALLSAVGWGSVPAVAAYVVLETWLAEAAVLPKWEALLALVAAVLVITMVIYIDRKSTRLNSSHVRISYAVFCLKKKKAPLRT